MTPVELPYRILRFLYELDRHDDEAMPPGIWPVCKEAWAKTRPARRKGTPLARFLPPPGWANTGPRTWRKGPWIVSQYYGTRFAAYRNREDNPYPVFLNDIGYGSEEGAMWAVEKHLAGTESET